mmetsp:Transcript_27002/g.38325  ORF Transcript_27002/g.38325 Transcript_27002/m.38325 type:complete len:130 (-) Transcript_27002:60-449(-)
MAEHRAGVDFACIYIQEAHASDEWPINQLEQDVPQHRTLHDRVAAATAFVQAQPSTPVTFNIKDPSSLTDNRFLPLFVDSPSNQFNHAYSSWPFRFWVVYNGTVRFKAMPQNCTYDLNDLRKHLLTYSG